MDSRRARATQRSPVLGEGEREEEGERERERTDRHCLFKKDIKMHIILALLWPKQGKSPEFETNLS